MDERYYRNDMRRGGYNRDMEDERNPYGSAGGYVTSRRGRDSMDERDYRNDMRHGGYSRGRGDERTFRMDYEDDRRSRGYEDERYMRDSRSGMDYRNYNDYGHGYLSNKELQKWQNKLCKELDQQECEMFKYEHIIHQAEEMNIMFDRYTKEEFYTTVLMMYSDYKKTCANNIPMYISLAKEFLEDKDAKVCYGEKLAAYYDNIADV